MKIYTLTLARLCKRPVSLNNFPIIIMLFPVNLCAVPVINIINILCVLVLVLKISFKKSNLLVVPAFYRFYPRFSICFNNFKLQRIVIF